jgi:hypothetical protein
MLKSSFWIRLFVFGAVFLFVANRLQAQSATPRPEPIKDNSFLIEEAYNQEAGVVQHISTFSRSTIGGGWAYSFTQEWPVRGMRHQLSYTIPVFDAGIGATGRGVGDAAINYRYQLAGVDGGRLAISPRASLILATGNVSRGTGVGGTSIQTNLPVSVEATSQITMHANAGFTYTAAAHNVLGDRAATTSYAAGGSVIWLATGTFNVMLESLWSRASSVVAPSTTASADQFVIAPGIRWAHNLRGDLQVVPGIAYVIGAGPSRGDRSLFVYLSIEHPFAR